jgi:hypothetical protein
VSNFDDWVVARTAVGTIADTDLFPIVDDPAGTPSTKKVTAADLATYVQDGISATGRTVRTPEQDGAAGDALVLHDAAITNGDATLTSATAVFTGRSGESVWVAGAGAAGALLSTTIASVTNATTVELNTTASTTVTNAQALVGTNDTSALNTWLARGASNIELRVTPGAVYAHSGVLSVTTKTDVLLTGKGARFVAPVQATSGFKFFDHVGFEIRGLEVAMHPEPTTRGTTEDHYGLFFQGVENFEFHDLHAEHSHAAGILLLGCTDGRGYNTTSVRTRADGLHFTGGSARIRWYNHRSQGVEDDSVAIVSYDTATVCSDIKVYGARSWYPKTAGRCFVVVGGDDCWYYDFEGHGSLQAGLYFACESSFESHTVTNSGAVGGRLVNCVRSASFDHPAIFVYNGRTGTTNDNITFLDVEVVDSGSQPTSYAAVGVGNDAGSGGDNERITMGATGQPIVISGTYWPPSTKYDSGQTPATSSLVLQARTLPQMYLGNLEQDPGSLADGATSSGASVTVTGVTAAGSVVLGVTHTGANGTNAGLRFSGQVSGNDTVRVYATNTSGGAIDIGNGYWHVVATDI